MEIKESLKKLGKNLESKEFEKSLKKLLQEDNEVKKIYCYFEIDAKKDKPSFYFDEHKINGDGKKIIKIYEKVLNLMIKTKKIESKPFPERLPFLERLKEAAENEPCINKCIGGKYYLFLRSSKKRVRAKKFKEENKTKTE